MAGSGADASPYFRIFNPITQSERFDPNGQYIRAYLPQLALIPDKYIHFPAKAPSEVLAEAQCEMGKDYPFPIVDHAQQRLKALSLYKRA